MYIIKRDGSQAVFDPEKIRRAIQGANKEVLESNPYGGMSDSFVAFAVEEVVNAVEGGVYGDHAVNVEDIQDIVENTLIKYNAALVAKAYIMYRQKHEMLRRSNTTDDGILALIECNNEEVKQENSNKNPTVVSVQRDYMAGEVSKDLSRRILLPEDVVKAHDDGIIHFHELNRGPVRQRMGKSPVNPQMRGVRAV